MHHPESVASDRSPGLSIATIDVTSLAMSKQFLRELIEKCLDWSQDHAEHR